MFRFVAPFLLLTCGCHIIHPRSSDSMPATSEDVVPIDENDFLALAANCIEKGDQAGAAGHMLRHLQTHPDQIMIRAYLAELLVRMKRPAEAKQQFESFITEAQQTDGPCRKHLVHCHTRLMELALERDDLFEETLHRGIGLFLLAEQHDAIDETDPSRTEQLLFKAVKELESAAKLHKEDGRSHWYLHQCWSKLNQPLPAERELRQAEANASFSRMTPGEQRELRIACRK